MTAKGFQGIDRETYKQTKKMDREKMSQFLTDIYDMGYEDGRSECISLIEIEKRFSEINGIGKKRVKILMDVLTEYLAECKANNFLVPIEEKNRRITYGSLLKCELLFYFTKSESLFNKTLESESLLMYNKPRA